MINFKAASSFFAKVLFLSQVFSFALCPSLFAQSETAKPAGAGAPLGQAPLSKKSEVQGQWATIKTDNAMVYEQPDFDAPTLMYLPAGQKVRVSRKTFGSYFKFYRVKVSQTKIGYITTIDVVPEVPGPPEKGVSNKTRKKKNKLSAKPTMGKYPPVKAFIATRYMGFYVGNLNYKETIPGIDPTATLLIYGIKLTGPRTLIALPTDFNFIIHYGAPAYYSQFSSSKPAGFIMIADLMLLFPIADKKNSSFYLGLGPLLDYSSFQFGTTAGVVSSIDLSLGLSAEIGFGIKLGTNWALRSEYKLMWERANYTSYGASIQNRF